MSRSKILFRPSLAAALGGLLLVGPMAGQAQDKPQAEDGVPVVPVPLESDRFSSAQPFPWPAFLGVYPAPGRYHSRLKVAEFSVTGALEMDDLELQAIMRESMNSEQTYCIRGDEPLEDWAEEIGVGACEQITLEREGDDFSMHMACRHESGAVMELNSSGSVTPTASRITIAVTETSSEVGRVYMRFTSLTRRLGDCE